MPSNLTRWWSFWPIFHEGFNNVNFINVGRTPSTHNSAHAAHIWDRLQATWVELARWGGLSDQKIKKVLLLELKKLSFWESPVKICYVAGTPIATWYTGLLNYRIFKVTFYNTFSSVVKRARLSSNIKVTEVKWTNCKGINNFYFWVLFQRKPISPYAETQTSDKVNSRTLILYNEWMKSYRKTCNITRGLYTFSWVRGAG